jgi:Cys-tRNA(Pro)/Cys-tRNA(Cys) deacylase
LNKSWIKQGIAHDPLALNALKDDLPENISKSDIYKTLALTGNNGPVIGIIPLTQHLSEKKLAKVSGNKKSA